MTLMIFKRDKNRFLTQQSFSVKITIPASVSLFSGQRKKGKNLSPRFSCDTLGRKVLNPRQNGGECGPQYEAE